MKHFSLVAGLLLLMITAGVTYGQQPSTDEKYVSREEYDKLKNELETLKSQMQVLMTKQASSQPAASRLYDDPTIQTLNDSVLVVGAQTQEPQAKGKSAQAELDEAIDELEKQIKSVKDVAQAASPGTTNFLITGYGFTNYTDREGERSSFKAQMEPIFLWRLSARIFFEGEAEFALENNE